MNELDGKKLAVGIIINAVVIAFIANYDINLAFMYTLLLFFLVIFFYRERIAGSIAATIALIEKG